MKRFMVILFLIHSFMINAEPAIPEFFWNLPIAHFRYLMSLVRPENEYTIDPSPKKIFKEMNFRTHKQLDGSLVYSKTIKATLKGDIVTIHVSTYKDDKVVISWVLSFLCDTNEKSNYLIEIIMKYADKAEISVKTTSYDLNSEAVMYDLGSLFGTFDKYINTAYLKSEIEKHLMPETEEILVKKQKEKENAERVLNEEDKRKQAEELRIKELERKKEEDELLRTRQIAENQEKEQIQLEKQEFEKRQEIIKKQNELIEHDKKMESYVTDINHILNIKMKGLLIDKRSINKNANEIISSLSSIYDLTQKLEKEKIKRNDSSYHDDLVGIWNSIDSYTAILRKDMQIKLINNIKLRLMKVID